jgi:hypothetical protein
MRRSTVVRKDKATISDVGRFKWRGFKHVYKTRNTSLSCRVHSAYNLSMQNGHPQNKQAMKLDKAKKKIYSLLVDASLP